MDPIDRQLGPVDFAIFEFPGDRLSDAIAPNIVDVVDRGIVTVLDLLAIKKDAEGHVVFSELGDLSSDEIGALSAFTGALDKWVSEEDIEDAASVLEPDTSALVMVWENTWAAPLATALLEANGQLVSSGRIPAHDVMAAAAAAE